MASFLPAHVSVSPGHQEDEKTHTSLTKTCPGTRAKRQSPKRPGVKVSRAVEPPLRAKVRHVGPPAAVDIVLGRLALSGPQRLGNVEGGLAHVGAAHDLRALGDVVAQDLGVDGGDAHEARGHVGQADAFFQRGVHVRHLGGDEGLYGWEVQRG